MKHFPHQEDNHRQPAYDRPISPSRAAGNHHWVASWSASPQPVWGSDFYFPTNLPSVLREQTVRQVARLSLGGERVRIVLSNAHGTAPLHIGRASIARTERLGGHAEDASLEMHCVTFGREVQATVLAGAMLVSDPVELPVDSLSQLTVSLYLPHPTPVETFHWDGRQTTWIVPGDQTARGTLDAAAPSMSTTARPLLAGIHVERGSSARTVVALGDSITDGATASLDQDTRWPDFLAERLAPQGVAVVNAGISGARLLSDCMGVNALARLQRDVLMQPGVEAVVVAIGINDIGWPGTALARHQAPPSLDALKAGYRQLVTQLHGHGVRVIGATLTPFEGAMQGTPLDDYFQPEKEALRGQLNDWIRHGHLFDAVVDFDAVLRDPLHPARMLATLDSGDHLHPGDAGSLAMAEALDLGVLLQNSQAWLNPPSRPTP
ncbi:MAG: SGNH/GDSL hydrolase family protein [Burkholderiaceae bacterium]|jgi:lysophospholipase L1-like esterase|nr:SGNH/GDSL hydrolase family protein [Burkholderiaceae bacterium]